MSCVAEQDSTPGIVSEACEQTRERFSAYLDGALDGRTMAQLAAHMDQCGACAHEFSAWRTMQNALGELGPAKLPLELQSRLRDVLASEIVTGRHLSPFRRLRGFWRRTLAPAGLRLGAGFAATSVILGTAAWFLGTALPVQADDERMAHLNAPKFLYSEAAPEPLMTGRSFVTVLVDAKVDAAGRVYDFDMIEGPNDPGVRVWVESNLLGSVFKPATVFGAPVPGHVMMTYTAISARA